MKPNVETTWTASTLAIRWGYHPSSVIRVMRRFGFSGLKFGTSKQAARRYADADVRKVEKVAAFHPCTARESARHAAKAAERKKDAANYPPAPNNPAQRTEQFSQTSPPAVCPTEAKQIRHTK